MSSLNLFLPLTKVDVENRLVYGLVAEEVVDNSGEMFDYEKSKPYFQKWSDNAELTSGGLSKGNLRAMHGKVAAGKLTELVFDDDAKRVECVAKVIDDNEWNKCLEGVYTGFSMGGRYAEKWTEKSDNGLDVKKYAGDPAEISLVDKPCIPTATFQMIKSDGVVEDCHFTTVLSGDKNMSDFIPNNDDLIARSEQLAKADGKDAGSWSNYVDAAREQLVSEHLGKSDEGKETPENGETKTEEGDIDKGDFEEDAETGPNKNKVDAGTDVVSGDGKGDEEDDDKDKVAGDEDADAKGEENAEKADFDTGDEVVQGWKAKDGSFHLKKSDAIARNKEGVGGLMREVLNLKKSVEDAKAPAQVVLIKNYSDFYSGVIELAKSDASGQELNKSMWHVERLARVLCDAASLQIACSREEGREGDSESTVPATVGVAVGALGEALIEMAKEEVGELLLQVANNEITGDGYYSHSDSYYELAHSTLGLEKSEFDNLVKEAAESVDYQKMHDDLVTKGAKCADMNKADDGELSKMASEKDALLKRAEDAEKQIEDAMPLLKSLAADVAEMKNLPRPPAPVTNVVEKSDDGKQVSTLKAELAQDLLKSHSPEELALAAIRLGQQNGFNLTSRG